MKLNCVSNVFALDTCGKMFDVEKVSLCFRHDWLLLKYLTMSGGSSMVIPMVLWGTRAPTHCISAILMTPDTKNVITGCNDGQICIWDVADEWQVLTAMTLHTK